MSRTMAMHVLYKSWYVTKPSSAKQHREMIMKWYVFFQNRSLALHLQFRQGFRPLGSLSSSGQFWILFQPSSLLRETNSYVDSVTLFRSMMLLCQRSPHIIDIQHHVLNGTEQEQLALLRGLLIRFACGQYDQVCLRLVSLHFACGQLLFVCQGNSRLIYSTVHYMQLKFRGCDSQLHGGAVVKQASSARVRRPDPAEFLSSFSS